MPQVLLTFSAPFHSLAQGEAHRHGLSQFQTLSPETMLAACPDCAALAQHWLHRPPIYIRHMFPVQRSGRWRGTGALRRELAEFPPARLQLRLPAWHPPGEEARLEGLWTGAPERILSVLVHETRWWAGLSAPRLNLSPWKGGAPQYEVDSGLVNRCEWKLREAIDTFGWRLGTGRALDLGACPGGWSRVLLRYGLSVTAVDPRPEGMTVQHARLEHRAEPAECFLRSAPAGGFDVLTNDMWLPAEETARLTRDAAPLLRPGGMALVTLKLGNVSPELESRRGPLRRALAILREAYRIPRLRQLFYNRFEVTAWLVRS
ncbi:hypothetical protein IV102_28075 [bacterium]|nr:hypothetical protein [bacterium]